MYTNSSESQTVSCTRLVRVCMCETLMAVIAETKLDRNAVSLVATMAPTFVLTAPLKLTRCSAAIEISH